MKKLFSLACLAGLWMFACGCASTIPFTVKYDRLKDPPAKREGTLAVKPLADKRAVTNAMQIGGKWAKAKPVYVAKQQRPVADLVTDGLRDALQKVGYTIQASPDSNTAVLEGDMSRFWLTDDWGGAVCEIALQLRLRRGENGQVLWEKGLTSKEDDWAIIPNAMVAALNTLLKSAMSEFSSQAFVDAVAPAK